MKTPPPGEPTPTDNNNGEPDRTSGSNTGSPKQPQDAASTPANADLRPDGQPPRPPSRREHIRSDKSQNKPKAQRRRPSESAPVTVFKALDRVHLTGGLGDFDQRVFGINDQPLPPLDRRKFLVLLVLVSHSLALSGVEPPVKVAAEPFLTGKMILDAIIGYLQTLKYRPPVFLDPDPMHVTDMIYEIRKALGELKLNRNLIENGPSRYGYRLGAQPQNVELTFTVPGTQQVIRLKGRKLR
jgi:hypothetical protein